MRMSIIGLVALGLVAAFSAALLMAAMGKTPGSMRANNSGDRDITVLVAARDMPAVSKVHADDLEERTIKAKDMPKGGMQDPIHVVGKTLVRPLIAGEPVTKDCFADNNRGMELVSNLPPGKRAVTVELKLSDGLEGLLYPGSVVDVLAFFRFDRDMKKNVADAVSTTMLQGVEVLAIDDTTASSQEEDGNTNAKDDGALARRKTRRVTLLVDSRQAEALQLASAQGTVSLAMRNPLDTTEADRDATLLSGGQLASLAEYMGAWVGEEEDEVDGTAPVLPVEMALPTKTPRRTSQWEVTVMRGDQVDVTSFTRDAGEAQVADRMN